MSRLLLLTLFAILLLPPAAWAGPRSSVHHPRSPAAGGPHAWDMPPGAPRRIHNRSPAFRVAPADVAFFMNYTGFTPAHSATGGGARFFVGQIDDKVLDMIDKAETHILLSVFLFDSFYADAKPERDIVGALSEALLRKRLTHPGIRIAIILDPSHKAYGRRMSPVERRFRETGIDVFYSDLLSDLKRASLLGVREGLGHANRGLDVVTFGVWGDAWTGLFSHAKLPMDFDGDPMSLENVYNALLLKANHRKILVTDVRGGDYEVLISSANPHNASAFHINSAISARGAPARYAFNMLREDMAHSADLGSRYAHWHFGADRAYRRAFFAEGFPPLELPSPAGTAASRSAAPGLAPVSPPAAPRDAAVTVVTEEAIPENVIELLSGVGPSDDVRIQMFYMSYQPVLDAVLAASRITRKPVRLLLDANKDSFNKEKDGTPNRQVARYLLRKARETGGRIEVRWYSTHGEQNHAKTMSITSPETGKCILTTGSCNWTGRNMDGVNMEANIVVENARGATDAFNALFDRFWSNSDGNEYSLDYDTYRDQTAPDRKWILGEKPFYYSTF